MNGDLMDAVRALFPRCIYCGQPCTDPKQCTIVERTPVVRRLAHLECQTKSAA